MIAFSPTGNYFAAAGGRPKSALNAARAEEAGEQEWSDEYTLHVWRLPQAASTSPPGEANRTAAEGLLRLGHDVQVVTESGRRGRIQVGESLPAGRFRLVKVARTETMAAGSDYERLAGSIARCLDLESMTVKSLVLPTVQVLARAPGLRELVAGGFVGGEGLRGVLLSVVQIRSNFSDTQLRK